MVELADGVLVVCGDLRQCWTYSQGNDSWVRAGELSQERRRASSVSVGGRMFVTGGYLPGRGTFTTTEVWTSRRGWRPASLELSPGRDGHCTVAWGRHGAVITGGWGAETVVQHINISSKDRLSHANIMAEIFHN